MRFVLALLIFSSISYAAPTKCRKSITKIDGKVSKISDGDTIQVQKGAETFTIRLLGIDTPELHFQGQSQGVWAVRATETLESKIPLGSEVQVIFDQEPCDSYGRHLGYVMREERDINAEQIEAGVAVNYCIFPNILRCRKYAALMEKSIEDGKSFVSEIVLPYEFRWEMSGRGAEKPVADMRGTEVKDPLMYREIPIAHRLFFMNWGDVKPPYHRTF